LSVWPATGFELLIEVSQRVARSFHFS
jgi:hypothetical protein